MKKCPFCGEEIQESAKKCRYCKEFLVDKSEIPQPSLGQVGASPELSQEADAKLTEMQKAADFISVRKTLKPSGVGSIFWGIIAIGIGASTIGDNPLNAFLFVIGGFLLVEGIFNIVHPTPGGIVADGITMVVLGLWNVTITVLNAIAAAETGAKGGGSNFFAILGVFQVIWGVTSFKRYKRFARISFDKPSEESVKQVDEVVRSIVKTKTKNSNDIIDFQANNRFWKAKLLGDIGIFVEGGGSEILFMKRIDVNLVSQRKVTIGKSLRMTLQMAGRNLSGTISPESFAKYEAWKSNSLNL